MRGTIRTDRGVRRAWGLLGALLGETPLPTVSGSILGPDLAVGFGLATPACLPPSTFPVPCASLVHDRSVRREQLGSKNAKKEAMDTFQAMEIVRCTRVPVAALTRRSWNLLRSC
jgi:hypothetical protein